MSEPTKAASKLASMADQLDRCASAKGYVVMKKGGETMEDVARNTIKGATHDNANEPTAEDIKAEVEFLKANNPSLANVDRLPYGTFIYTSSVQRLCDIIAGAEKVNVKIPKWMSDEIQRSNFEQKQKAQLDGQLKCLKTSTTQFQSLEDLKAKMAGCFKE